jgi:peptidoglycan hydrolase-like protein with peptidoglycan-binding domain
METNRFFTANRFFPIGVVLLLIVAVSISPVMATSPASAGGQSEQLPIYSGKQLPDDQTMRSQKNSPSDEPIYIGPVELERIQRQLKKRGANPGPVDGIWGISTANAVRSFQQSHGLSATGNLNLETIQALGLSQILEGIPGATAKRQKRWGETSLQGARLYISPSALQNIQQALHLQGFDVGQADGIWGDKTSEAIRRYQHDNDMRPTGHIDLSVLDRLGMIQLAAQLGFGLDVPGGQDGIAQQQIDNQLELHGYYGKGGESNKMQENRVMRGQEQASGGGAPLFAGIDMIRRIQQALSDEGYNPGPINGQWSASTEKALGEY